MTDKRDRHAERKPAPRWDGAGATPANPYPRGESDDQDQHRDLYQRTHERMRDAAMMNEKIGAGPSPVSRKHFGPIRHVGGNCTDQTRSSDVAIGDRAPERGADEGMSEVVHATRCATTSRGVQGNRSFASCRISS